jgi:hypothetical protein
MNDTDLRPDQFDYLAADRARSTVVAAKQKRPPKNPIRFLIGMVVSGGIGLGLGYLLLCFLFPGYNFFGEVAVATSSAGEGLKTRHSTKTEASSQHNLPLKKKRVAAPLSPPIGDQSPSHSPSKITPSPNPIPQDKSPSHDEPRPNAPPPPKEIRRQVVLDLSRSVLHLPFPEVLDGQKAQARVEDVAHLATVHELKPANGIISRGRPVDILLTDYPGISVHLSLTTRSGVVVIDVAPRVAVDQGKGAAFTRRFAKQASVSANKGLDIASQRLAMARATAQSIEDWIKSPVAKSLQLRAIKRHQLDVLKDQVIPGLEQQVKGAQARVDATERLVRLVDQIDGTVHICLAITRMGDTYDRHF